MNVPNCFTCGVRGCTPESNCQVDAEIQALQQRINELMAEINSAEAQIETLQLTILQRQLANEEATR